MPLAQSSELPPPMATMESMPSGAANARPASTIALSGFASKSSKGDGDARRFEQPLGRAGVSCRDDAGVSHQERCVRTRAHARGGRAARRSRTEHHARPGRNSNGTMVQ